MKFHRTMGVLGAAVCCTAAMMSVLPLAHFFDPISVLFVVYGTLGVMMATHGRGSLQLISALTGWLFRTQDDQYTPKEHLQIAAKALDFGEFAILTGAVGMTIGHVQMLQQMDDPNAIGPALAVSMLTLLYGALAHMLVAVPLSRHHLLQAGAEAVRFRHRGPGLRILGVMGLSSGIGFFVMLAAMGGV